MGWLIKLWEYSLSVRDFLKRIFINFKLRIIWFSQNDICFLVNLNSDIFIFLWCCLLYLLFLGGDRQREAQLSLACEQALLLGESREVTREPHGKGGASARGPLPRTFSRGFLRLPLEIESLLARRLTLFDLRGSVAEWSARRTRNAAVPGSSSALSSATLVIFPKPTSKVCFFKISLSSFSMQPSFWDVSKSRTPHFQTLARLMTFHSSLTATTGYNFGPSV